MALARTILQLERRLLMKNTPAWDASWLIVYAVIMVVYLMVWIQGMVLKGQALLIG